MMRFFYPRHCPQQLAADMLSRADAGMGVGELARLRTGERDGLGKGLHRQIIVDGDDARHAAPA